VGSGDPAAFDRALRDAFEYRGDVTITLDDGSTAEGYVFDQQLGKDPASSCIRLLPKDSNERRTIPCSRIRAVTFSGKDPAAGKTWENWIRRYAEKKLKGEAAGIDSEPLD